MRTKSIAIAFLFACLGLLLSLGSWKTGAAAATKVPHVTSADQDDDPGEISLLDDCDARDPAWAATGGCKLKNGDVTNAEFGTFLTSPLSLSTVGHPAWTIEPTYLKAQPSVSVKVTNRGGRVHTFTEVANFGGGRVRPLNKGLVPAPECIASSDVLAPGERIHVKGLGVGNHRFQCCIHPWMRALINVNLNNGDDLEGDHDPRNPHH